MRTLMALAVLAMPLAACATTSSSTACPREVVYTPEQEKQAADELDAMVPGVIRDQFIPDYGRLRAQARACRGALPAD